MKPYQKLLCLGLIYGILLWGLWKFFLWSAPVIVGIAEILFVLYLFFMVLNAVDDEWEDEHTYTLTGSILAVIVCMVLRLFGIEWFTNLTGIKLSPDIPALITYPIVLCILIGGGYLAKTIVAFIIGCFKKGTSLSDSDHFANGAISLATVVAIGFNILFNAVMNS